MAITLTLPGLGSQGLSTKDAIISILSARWPLSLKQIHQIARTDYGVSATYQAIHKMLNQLVKEEVVTKAENGFSLNSAWIKKIKSFGDQLDTVYSNERTFSDFQNKDVVNLYFEGFIPMARFIIHTFNWEFPNPQNKPRIIFASRVWMPAGADENDFAQLKKIFTFPYYYGLYKGNSVLDHYASSLLVKIGKRSLHGVKHAIDGDLVIQGDYVAQIFYPLSFKTKSEKLFKNTHSIENFDLMKVFELYSEKHPIKVVITRNSELAESLRKEGIKLYEKHQQTEKKKGR